MHVNHVIEFDLSQKGRVVRVSLFLCVTIGTDSDVKLGSAVMVQSSEVMWQDFE